MVKRNQQFMKRNIFLAALVLLLSGNMVHAQQYDTLPYSVDVPWYYMNHHFDSVRTIYDEVTSLYLPQVLQIPYRDSIDYWIQLDNATGYCGRTAWRTVQYDEGNFVFAFYPDSELAIIGVAWYDMMTELVPHGIPIRVHGPGEYITLEDLLDTVEARLYLPENNTLVLAAERKLKYDSAASRRIYDPHYQWCQDVFYNSQWPVCVPAAPIYEAYFDRETRVTDSFFISVKHLFSDSIGSHRRFDRTLGWVDGGTHYGRPGMPWSHYPYQAYRMQETDTGVWKYGEVQCYPLLFPIVRLAGDTCPDVRELRWSIVGGGGTAFVQWAAGTNHRNWQLSYGPEGTPAGEGTVVDCNMAQCIIPNLTPNMRYDVYVRARCRFARDEWTAWTDPMQVCLGGCEGIQAADAPLAALSPNPASGSVNVSCSEAISMVEVYDIKGRCMMAQNVGAGACSLDISSLAAGHYTVRIHTAKGIASKPLSVQ